MKDIAGYEGEYAVTEDGKVWSYKTKRYLKPEITKNGYLKVCLSKKSQKRKHFVHRLVAEAYINNPDKLSDVNHKDENKQNNSINNLEWLDHKSNICYSQASPVYCIELNKTFISIREAENILNISHGCIAKCCKGKQQKAGGYHWRYVE